MHLGYFEVSGYDRLSDFAISVDCQLDCSLSISNANVAFVNLPCMYQNDIHIGKEFACFDPPLGLLYSFLTAEYMVVCFQLSSVSSLRR